MEQPNPSAESRFKAIYAQYAKPLYLRLLQQTGDADRAQQVLKLVFREVRQKLTEEAAPEQLWLEMLAEKQLASFPDEQVTVVEMAEPAAEMITAPKKKRKLAWLWCLLPILLVLLLVGLWAGYGWLAAMEAVPAVDLGYEWFDRVVYPLFQSIEPFEYFSF